MYSPSLSKSCSMPYELRGNKRKRSELYNMNNKFPAMPPFGKPPKHGGDDDDDDDDDSQMPMPFKFPKLFGNDHSSDVYTTKNHIYFKTGITKDSIDKLATEIDNLNNKLSNLAKKATLGTFTPKPIYLHITTNGGDLLAGFFAYDKIKESKIPIITIIEGCVASALAISNRR